MEKQAGPPVEVNDALKAGRSASSRSEISRALMPSRYRIASRPAAEMLVSAASRSLGLAWKAMPRPARSSIERVVGAVADGDDLVEQHALGLGDRLEQLGLALGVDDRPDDAAGELAARDLEVVRVGVVDAQPALERLGGAREAAADDGDAGSPRRLARGPASRRPRSAAGRRRCGRAPRRPAPSAARRAGAATRRSPSRPAWRAR